MDVSTAEDGAGWLTFLRSLTSRGLSGVGLITSDAHAGLLAAIGATLPGTSWQRCLTHFATNPMAITPRLVVRPVGIEVSASPSSPDRAV